MTQKTSGNILIALLINSLAFANPLMAVKAAAKKATVKIAIDNTDTACCAKTKAPADTACADSSCAADACTDSCPVDATRALAPAQPGGIIVTPAFEYSIKASDLATPTASGAAFIPASGVAMYTINNPGRYYIASDISAKNTGSSGSSTTNNTMIYINASNVIFDMNGKTLFPAGTGSTSNGAGLTAVLVAPSLSNVVIKNGQINGNQPNGTTSYICTGIVVGAGCSNITISDVAVSNVGGGALTPNSYLNPFAAPFVAAVEFKGSTGATTTCSDIILQNISVNNTNSSVSATSVVGLLLNFCNGVQLNSCNFGGSQATGASTPAAYGTYLSFCNTIAFDGCSASQNGTGSTNNAFGFYTNATSAVSFNNCDASQTTGALTSGFNLVSGGPYKLTNCTASNASGAAATYGFNVNALATLTNCSAESNSSSAAICYGIYVSDADGSKLTNCQANQNTGTGGQAVGIYINASDSVLLENCSTNGNTGTATSVSGFYLTDSDSCQLNNCSTGENNTATSGIPVYGFYIDSTSNILNNCVSGHNYNSNAASTTTLAAGFYLTGASGTQVVNCQARNNYVADTSSSTAGFYSGNSGRANEFRNCQAINNACLNALATGNAVGIWLNGETLSQILASNCSANYTGTGTTGTGYGIFLQNSSSNTIVRDNSLNFNVGALKFGFFDDAAETSSVLINNQAAGHGRCFPVNTSYAFPVGQSMNFFFYTAGGLGENPTNIIVETDNFNWQVISTAVSKWSNISIVIGQLA